MAGAGLTAVPPAAAQQTQAQAAAGSSPMTEQDKALMKQVLGAIKRDRWSEARQLIHNTNNPAATRLYDWLYYRKGGESVQFNGIARFINHHPDWPSQNRLRLNAEKIMPADLPYGEVIAWFSAYEPQTPDGMNRYLSALMAKKDMAGAEKVLKGWWKTASLTPEQQAYFLTRYGPLIDKQSQAARFGHLMMKEQYTNARALARRLGRGYPELAEARIVLAAGQGGVDGALARVPGHLMNDPGLLYERLRWRRKKDMDLAAIEILHQMPSIDIIPNPEAWWTERHIMARRLIEQKQYGSAYLLVKKHQNKTGVPFAEAEFMAGWLALEFLNKPWDAFEHFERLYHGTETTISKSRGAYWAGRASEKLGHPEVARQWYSAAAQYQTAFYGQMAIGALDVAYKPAQQRPPERSYQSKQAFDRNDMVQAVRLLNAVGMREETKLLLTALADSIKAPEEFRLVAEMADDMGYRNSAVNIAKKGLNKGILLIDQAFPTLLSFMKPVTIEWAFTHAIIRQESAFDEGAMSPVGARGLMQLMPATAAEVAKKNGMAITNDELVRNPSKNIRLGSLYLQQMINRYNGSYVLAAAAYNAGPGRVDRWLKENGDPRTGQIDIVNWIEMIPVGETRNYVQRVLEGVYIYRQKLQGVQKQFDVPIHVATRTPA